MINLFENFKCIPKVVIIDEMSMVGAKFLHLIDRYCRDIFPNVDESFGDLHVYMFGDF